MPKLQEANNAAAKPSRILQECYRQNHQDPSIANASYTI